jgi:hypothetical protein
LDTHLQYEIRVDGHLNDRWLDWFEGLSLVNEASGEAVLITQGGDQALLHGVLARMRDLNLTLISVRRIESDPTHHPKQSQ